MTLHDFAPIGKVRKPVERPSISPLVGEMSAKLTEGGKQRRGRHIDSIACTQNAPLCPAGHLPHEGGDRLGAPPAAPIPPMGKVTGSRHLAAALGYSLGGAARLLRETAFRHELLAAIAIFGAFAFAGASLSDYVSMAVLFLALIAAEALNTAIEEIIDRISPEWSKTGKNAKDLGSFAVLCLAAANGLMAAFVIGSKLLSA